MSFILCVFICRLELFSFRETCQWLEFPLNGLRAQSRVSPVVGLLRLVSGPACLETECLVIDYPG